PLIERPGEFQRFLGVVKDIETASSLPIPVWRGLLSSYFAYNMEERRSLPGQDGWRALRAFLKESFEQIWTRRTVHQEWMKVLHANRNLFEDQPADPYAEDLLAGRLESVRRLLKTLVISQQSWFVGALVMAQVRRAAA